MDQTKNKTILSPLKCLFVAAFIGILLTAMSRGSSCYDIALRSRVIGIVWLLCLAIVWIITTVKAKIPSKSRTVPEHEKICPYCAEEIRSAAVLCKHCKKSLTPIQDTIAGASILLTVLIICFQVTREIHDIATSGIDTSGIESQLSSIDAELSSIDTSISTH